MTAETHNETKKTAALPKKIAKLPIKLAMEDTTYATICTAQHIAKMKRIAVWTAKCSGGTRLSTESMKTSTQLTGSHRLQESNVILSALWGMQQERWIYRAKIRTNAVNSSSDEKISYSIYLSIFPFVLKLDGCPGAKA